MSDLLKAFLRSYLDWVETGAYMGDVFGRLAGLCSNFRWHMRRMNVSEREIQIESDGLKCLFFSEGLDEDYPFGGQDQYESESCEELCHANEARIAWVRAKVAQHVAA